MLTQVIETFDVVLRDGSTLTLRPGREEDVPALLQFFESLSPQSAYMRFMGFRKLDAEGVRRFATTDPSIGYSLVGEFGGRIIAAAGYYRTDVPDLAEVAFAIADARQGRGIGTRMLDRLADVARAQGIRAFEADVLGENRKMMQVFVDSGYELTRRIDRGVVHFVLSLDRTPNLVEKAAQRSQVAATASMKAFFEPASIAVVGANRERGKIGSEILHNLRSAGFPGALVPVHPTATEVQGLPAYRRVADIPGPIDLAVISVPADRVLDSVDDCLAKGVRGICVISAGFSEAGPDGRAREAALVERIRAAGCRLIGPNCMGLLNTDPAFSLNATFSPVYPPAGGVAMSTQSGALGLAILDYARRLNIGISSFVSVGNKADVSGNDLIQYWAQDPRTSVILLYLESFGNPKKFSEIARRVARSKPIVAVKAGRSQAGARAASSHTGALASSDAVVDALFRQSGIIRTDTLEELFDVAALLAHQPVPRGRRVAILTNAGGPGILAADSCEANGLELPALSDATRAELRSFLPAAASVGNPVDMLASAPAEHFKRGLAAVLRDEHVDSVLVIFIPPLVTESDAVAAAIVESARHAADKPVAAIFMRADGAPAALAGIPCFAFPEAAAIALARAAAYGAWRQKPADTIPVFEDLDRDRAQGVVENVLARGGGWMTPDESQALMGSIGIATAPARMVHTAADAAAASRAMGQAVALKAIGPTLLHKTERQAIRLDLSGEAAVLSAYADLEARFGNELSGVLVQAMVPGGIEMLVGAVQDPIFGPLVVCGSGGVLVELVADRAFRIHPLGVRDAVEMIDELKGARLLRGYRGAPPVDEPALRDVLLRVSALLTICPEVQELDINPVKVLSSGVRAVDVRVRIDRPTEATGARRAQY
ncbi:MAG TPA: GNAT family N-acetyltransferase [Vicinamibacterales bacterium]|jgi:acetyl coenzyme A synthetase (ADP forming)-like protein|nr:GNAT family N-acetyltransferase [Vicinamibacterales bacterium]